MKLNRYGKRALAGMLVLFLLLTSLHVTDTYKADSIFDNARMFYEATSGNSHMMIDGATVYFATQGKLASSRTNLKYGSLGYDVTLTGGGYYLKDC